MNMMILSTGILCLALSTSCSKKNEKTVGTSGQAKVVLDNANALMISSVPARTQANTCVPGNTCATEAQISKFEIKLMSVGIHTHADTTQGYGSAIYANPSCPAPEYETEVNSKYYKYVGFGTCSDSSITTYFDLKSASVNTDLNSQYLPIAPGSYKYGAITFCQSSAQSNNYKITLTNDAGLPAALQGQTVSFSVGTCGVTTPEMSPSMDVTEGQSVQVTLIYDLTNTVYYRVLGVGESAGTGCTEVGGYAVCINPPTISATFAVQ